ncbi:calmodulin dependent protein kinase kinase [Acrasis kona]|uniref:Calmodulin dependent protein kinase kinase n=1 Tax=Acrasis kona TaxID=1008807 RepID=A0AAW2ZFF0_9EUKA
MGHIQTKLRDGDAHTRSEKSLFQSIREEDIGPRTKRSASSPTGIGRASIKKDETKVTNVLVLSQDEDGNKMVNNYCFMRTIGKGSYGKVKLCIDNNNRPYAVKVLNKSALKRVKKGDETAYSDVLREIAINKKLNHENCVRLFEVIDDPSNDKLYLVLEYVSNGSIKTDTALSEDKSKQYLQHIINGLEYLHSQKIYHRDIKPENLLLSKDDVVKLSDFGVSHLSTTDDDTLKVTAGTPAFLAPEACSEAPYSGRAADVWAVGVSLYMMCFAESPFSGDSYMEIYQSIINKELVIPDSASPDLRDILTRLLDKNPKTRITIPEIRKHSFMVHVTSPNKYEKIKVSQKEVDDAVLTGTRSNVGEKQVVMDVRNHGQDHLSTNSINRQFSVVESL